MEDIQKKAISQIVNQTGWQYVEDFIRQELIEGKKPLNLKTEGKTAEMIALEVVAYNKAGRMVENVLKRLHAIASYREALKESYK